MGEVKVETNSAKDEINNIKSAGEDINFKNDVDLSDTNIEPFTSFKNDADILLEALNNYKSIVSEDTTAMASVVDEFDSNDKEMANDISNVPVSK